MGGKAEVPDNPKHEDLLFIGWYDGDTEVSKFENIMEDLTVTSKYTADINNNGTADSEDATYNVTFYDTIGERNIRTVSILTGMDATAPTVPTHDGYTFMGWSRGFTNVTNNLTVNARYRLNATLPTTVTYQVTFVDGYSNTEISTETVENGLTANPPAVKEYPKKIFIGWDKSYSNITSNLTVTAIYADDVNENGIADDAEMRYTAIFETDGNGTLEGNSEFTNLLVGLSLKDNKVTIPEPKSNSGYEFKNWDLNFDENTLVSGNLRFKVIFKDIEKPTIEFISPNEGEILTLENLKGEVKTIDNDSLKRLNINLYDETCKGSDGSGRIAKFAPIFFENQKEAIENFYFSTVTLTDGSKIPDGKYCIAAQSFDLENNTIGTKRQVILDNTVPVVKVNLNRKAYINSGDIVSKINNPEFEATDTNLQKVVIYKADGTVQNETTTLTPPSRLANMNHLVDGSYYIIAYDAAGNKSEEFHFTMDSTEPDANLGYNPKKLTKGNVTVTLRATEEIKNLSGWDTTDNIKFTKVYAANTTEEVIIEDVAGNTKIITVKIENIDKDAPLIKINEADPEMFYNSSAKVTIEDANPDKLTVYRLTKIFGLEIKTKTTNPVNVEGNYLVTATDKAGNSSEVRFTVDKTSPLVFGNSILLITDGFIFKNNVKITAVDSNIDTIIVDGTTYDGKSITTEGEHTVVVKDKAGNSVSRTFIIDKKAPVIKINGEIPKSRYNVDALVTAEDNNLLSLVVTKKGKLLPVSATITEDGDYIAVAKDKAGNTTTITFTVDKKAPTVKATYSPSGPTNKDVVVTLKFSEEVKSLSEFGWNKANKTTWKKTYSENTTETVKFEDFAGNPGVDIEINVNNIDKIAPIAIITSPAKDGEHFGKNVTIIGEVDASEKNIKSHWFEITNPDGTLSYASNMDTNELSYSFDLDTTKGSGTYKIRYVATDKAGNRNDDPGYTNSAIRILEVDATDPETTIEVSEIVAGKFTVSGRATDNTRLNRVYVQLVSRTTNQRCGGTTINLLSPDQKEADWSVDYDIRTLQLEGCEAEGYYAAHVEAVDQFGNRGTAGWTDNFLVDKTRPKVEVLSPETGGYFNDSFTLSAKVTDNFAISSFTYNLYKEGELFKPNSIKNLTGKEFDFSKVIDGLEDGNYFFKINARDKVGTISNTVIVNFIIDNTDPGITLREEQEIKPSGSYFNPNKTVRIQPNDENLGKFYVNGKEYTQYFGDKSFGINWIIKENPTVSTFVIVSEDLAGNKTEAIVRIDRDAPNKPIITARIGYVAGTWTKENVILDFASTDNVTESSKLVYETTNSPALENSWEPISNPANYEVNVYNNVYVRAIDEAGNISENSNFFQVKVDKTKPAAPKVDTYGYVSGDVVTTSVKLRAYGSEELNNNGQQIAKESPIKYQFRYNEEDNWQDFSEVSFEPDNGPYDTRVTFRTVDEAGNISDPSETIHVIINKPDQSILKINNVYYKNDWQEQAWSTGTSVTNPTTSMAVRFKVITNSEIEFVKVIWTNDFNGVVGPSDLKKAMLNNPNLEGLVEVTKGADGYYKTTSPNNIEGTYKLGIVAMDKTGKITAWPGSNMHFKLADPIVPTVIVSYGRTEWTNENVVVTLNFSDEVKSLEEQGWTQDLTDQTIWRKTFSNNNVETLDFEDLAGNKGESVNINIGNIDKDGPEEVLITHTPTIETTDKVIVSVSANDNGVGLHDKAYSFDGGTTWQTGNSFEVGTNQTLSIAVRDKLDNKVMKDYIINNIIPEPQQHVDLIDESSSSLIYTRGHKIDGTTGQLELTLKLNSGANLENIQNVVIKYYDDSNSQLTGKGKTIQGSELTSTITDRIYTGDNGNKKYITIVTVNYKDSTPSKEITINSVQVGS